MRIYKTPKENDNGGSIRGLASVSEIEEREIVRKSEETTRKHKEREAGIGHQDEVVGEQSIDTDAHGSSQRRGTNEQHVEADKKVSEARWKEK